MIEQENIRQMSSRRVGLVLLAMAVAASLLLAPAAKPAQAAFPGKNGKIAFQTSRDGNDEIYVMNQDGSNPQNLTKDSHADHSPAWSPDGKKIAFSSRRDGGEQIFVMNKDGSNPVNLTNDASVGDEGPSWSPDGKKIVFDSFRDGNNGGDTTSEVYVMDTDPNTDDAKKLTDTPQDEFGPVFSPDGKKIVFDSAREGNLEIFAMDTDGSNPTNISNSVPGADFSPDSSPNTKKIAFASIRDNIGNPTTSEIYMMNPDGSNETRLTTNRTTDDAAPAFSPNGRNIAFQSDPNGGTSDNVDIIVMKADGTGQVNLTSNDSSNNLFPDWQPIKKR